MLRLLSTAHDTKTFCVECRRYWDNFICKGCDICIDSALNERGLCFACAEDKSQPDWEKMVEYLKKVTKMAKDNLKRQLALQAEYAKMRVP